MIVIQEYCWMFIFILCFCR